MSKEQIISKGKYTYAQPEDMVGVKQYLFVRDEDGKKRLLLRFANNRNEACSAFAFILYRMDARGKVLGQDKYECTCAEFAPNQVFSFDRKITVEDKCTDFKVQMVYANYGNYTYNVEHDNVSVAYSEKNTATLEKVSGNKKIKPRKIHARTFDMPWMFVVFSMIIMALAFAACGFLLKDFKEKQIDFTLSGVSYQFVDKEKKDEVVIMGCADAYREITLTGDIEGHRVVGIDKDAFAKNENLVYVNIDGLNIPNEAFKNCTQLKVLNIKNVNSIGDDAFKGCSKLESVTISHDKEDARLTIGTRAFSNCGSLETVEINQTLVYGDKVDYFYKSKNIETLKLKNFAYTIKDLNSAYITKIPALFGAEDGQGIGLVNISIEKMDMIPQGFAQGLKKLQSVTVSGTEIKTVGSYAFAECVSLNTLSLKGQLSTVGDYAFMSTGIKTIDMSKVKSLGVGAFKNATKLTTVTGLGAGGLDNIPKNTFDGCTSLASFTFHKNIKHIFAEAFKGTGLVKIVIPAGVSYDAGILKDCKKLSELEVYEFGAAGFVGQLFGASRDDTSDKVAGFIPNTLEKITLGSGREINESAFKGCKNVTVINLPGDIISIGDNAFSGCKKLTVVDIPAESTTLISIGTEAFSGCEKLKYVPLLDSLENIGKGALKGCNSLEAITLPFLGATPGLGDENETLSYIFGGSVPASLKEISLLDSRVTELPDYVFANSSGVKTIIIPNTVFSIGEYAFEGCTSLTKVGLSDGTSKDTGADLRKVVQIGAHSFERCTSLSTVELGEGLDIISASAFAETGIIKIAIPENVTYIGENILYKCNKIGSVSLPYLGADKNSNGRISYTFGDSIPASLKTVEVLYFKDGLIGESAFMGSSGVTNFSLPDGIEKIGEDAFKDCSSMNTFDFAEITFVGNGAFLGCTSLKDIDTSRVLSIGEESFYGCKSITRIDLSSLVSVGDQAFEKCSGLVAVTLGENIRTIGKNAFFETGLKSVALPEGVTELQDYTFGNCASLTSVQLPSTLSYIGDGVFSGTAVSVVEIPSGVTYLGGFVFKNSSVKTVKIPATVEYIGYNIFDGCDTVEEIEAPITQEMYGGYVSGYLFNGSFPDSLKKFTVNEAYSGIIHNEAFAYSYKLEEIIINADVDLIGTDAFKDCIELRYVSLPSSLRSVDRWAFDGCYRLYEISNPSGANIDCEYTIAYTPSLEQRATTVAAKDSKFALYNGSWYLVNYKKGENVNIEVPGSVGEYIVPNFLFYNDDDVKTVLIGGNAKSIGAASFANCDNLTKVELASSIVSIGESAFDSCPALTTVEMPESLVTIGDYAFMSCGSLSVIRLYSNVAEIGEDAFAECYSLYDVYNKSALRIVAGSNDYGYVAKNAVAVHTDMNEEPSSEVSIVGIGKFRSAGDNWLLIEGEVNEEIILGSFTYNGVTVNSYRVGKEAFAYSSKIKRVTITDAVVQLGERAFAGCDALVSVDCSTNKTITEIKAGTFEDCFELVRIELPKNVRVIDEFAFYRCQKLKEIDLPVPLERIGNGAFSGCSSLISVKLHQNVRSIGDRAFLGCDYLIEVYNLSSHLYVMQGSSSYGGVAKNAVAVFNDESQGLERYEQDGVKLIRGSDAWYLYDFVDEGKTVVNIPNKGADLIILPYAIVGGTFKGLVLPTNLVSVEYAAIRDCYNFEVIYYSGNADEWINISGVTDFAGFQGVLYKKSCVHYGDSGVWTYDVNNQVTTEPCQETSEAIVEASCYKMGRTKYKCACSGCDYERIEAEDMLTHNFVNGVCENCGGVKTQIDGTNIQSYIDGGKISTNGFVYDSAKGCFTSTNKESGTTSSFTIIASGDITISFTANASSLKDYDYLVVYENGVVYEKMSGKDSKNVEIKLKAGETLTITYEKSSIDGRNDDCGYIKGLYIIEATEQQSN